MAAALGSVRRDGNTAPFLDGAARGEFLLRRCSECGTFGGPQEASCPGCGSLATDWAPAGGGARVVSWSVVHGKAPEGGTAPRAVIVIAEFDEGPWWWSQLIEADADAEDVATGHRLAVAFAPAEGGETLPVFRLA
jgi:uncharacterized OB-fold protein